MCGVPRFFNPDSPPNLPISVKSNPNATSTIAVVNDATSGTAEFVASATRTVYVVPSHSIDCLSGIAAMLSMIERQRQKARGERDGTQKMRDVEGLHFMRKWFLTLAGEYVEG